MATVVVEAEPVTLELIETPIRAKFELDESVIVAMNARVESLVVADKQSRAMAWDERQAFRKLRLAVTKRQEALTEDAKAQIKSVKEVATVLLGLLTPGEDAIVKKIEAYDAKVEAAKREAEEAKKLALKARIDALIAVGSMVHPLIVDDWSEEEFQMQLGAAAKSFEAKQAAEAKERAEAAKLEAERQEALRIEQEKIDAERVEFERLKEEQAEKEWQERARKKIEEERIAADKAAEQAKIDEANRIERDAIEAERKAVQAERDRLELEKFLRQSKIREEQEAAERAKQEQLEAERIAAIKAEQERLALVAEAEAKARAEAMKPDIEKIMAFGTMIGEIEYPEMATDEGDALIVQVHRHMGAIVKLCKEFKSCGQAIWIDLA